MRNFLPIRALSSGICTSDRGPDKARTRPGQTKQAIIPVKSTRHQTLFGWEQGLFVGQDFHVPTKFRSKFQNKAGQSRIDGTRVHAVPSSATEQVLSAGPPPRLWASAMRGDPSWRAPA